jgi:hypothetical protein
MWTCPYCNTDFVKDNQKHSCNERSMVDHFKGKSATTIALYNHFIAELKKVGKFQIHPTKTFIMFSAGKNFAWVHRLGRDYVDITFLFDEAYEDNLCFYKIANVPGSTQHNHYFRMMADEDVNEEVKQFMKMAMDRVTS